MYKIYKIRTKRHRVQTTSVTDALSDQSATAKLLQHFLIRNCQMEWPVWWYDSRFNANNHVYFIFEVHFKATKLYTSGHQCINDHLTPSKIINPAWPWVWWLTSPTKRHCAECLLWYHKGLISRMVCFNTKFMKDLCKLEAQRTDSPNF